MHEISIPIPEFGENNIAEVVVTVNGEKKKFNFRVESFPWMSESKIERDNINVVEERIASLKKNIEDYDKSWELIQILTPPHGSKFIQALFRQKKS